MARKLSLPRYLKIHHYCQSRDVLYVYGPRDVVAYPVSGSVMRALEGLIRG